MKDATASINFEDSLNRLEALVKKLEQGELNLEDALIAFEEGIQLTRQCQSALQNAEQKVQQLIEDQGTLQAQPFDEHDGEQ